ncbi:MAG: phage virion morphogenesis protein [Gemmatimonadaceae bacterium]
MAPGVQVPITIESAQVKRALKRLGAAVQDLSEPMEEIGSSLVTSTQQRFEEKESPEGEAWQPVSKAHARRKVEEGRSPANILRFKNYLLQSISYLADRGSVAVGSNRVYAAIHQLGGTEDMAPGPAGIPARPYLGVSRDDEREIGAILGDYLGGAAA